MYVLPMIHPSNMEHMLVFSMFSLNQAPLLATRCLINPTSMPVQQWDWFFECSLTVNDFLLAFCAFLRLNGVLVFFWMQTHWNQHRTPSPLKKHVVSAQCDFTTFFHLTSFSYMTVSYFQISNLTLCQSVKPRDGNSRSKASASSQASPFANELKAVPWNSACYCWWKKSCTNWYGKYPIV